MSTDTPRADKAASPDDLDCDACGDPIAVTDVHEHGLARVHKACAEQLGTVELDGLDAEAHDLADCYAACDDHERSYPMGGACPDCEAQARYPLWCVDRGEAAGERQYAGPFGARSLAVGHAGPDEPVRRCRRVKASEIGLGFDGVKDIAGLIDERTHDGELPDNAWADFDDEVVTLGDLPAKTAAAFWSWADAHLAVKAFVCEGDEP